MPIELNPLAVANAATLRAIDETGWTQKTEISRRVGRDPKNAARDFGILESAGLIVESPPSEDDARPYALTHAARDQLAAIGRAEHGGEKRKARGVWPLDKMTPNPSNRTITEASVVEMAEAIEGMADKGGILQPLVLSPPDAHGVRTIWVGERRWRAACLLRAEGTLPEALEEGLPFTEREATRGEAAIIAIVENTAREDMSPWDDAKQLRIAADELGLSASELARRTGRAREGSRGGLRDVQSKLKVAREASPEAIAEYERDPAAPGAWERLRDSVSQPKAPKGPDFDGMPLVKAHQLALAELYAKAERRTDKPVPILPGAFQAEGGRLQQYGLAELRRSDKGDTAAVTPLGLDYLRHFGLGASNIAYDRETLKLPAGWGVTTWRTEWLNTLAKGEPETPQGSPDADTAAFAWVEPVTAAATPLTVADFGVPADFRAADHQAAQAWIEPGSYEAITLLNPKPGWRGFPDAEITLARVRGGEAWVSGHSFQIGHHAQHCSMNGIWSAREKAYRTRDEAILAAAATIRENAERDKAKGRFFVWLDNLLVNDPLVVNGVRYRNTTRAGEARRALGLEKVQANYGDSVRSAVTAEDVRQELDAGTEIFSREEVEAALDAPAAHPLAVAGPQDHPTNEALRLIAIERARQVEAEGYSPADDDQQNGDLELAFAAAAYCLAYAGEPTPGEFWPAAWDQEAFKPGDCEARCLVKAGALIVAELERLQRAGLA